MPFKSANIPFRFHSSNNERMDLNLSSNGHLSVGYWTLYRA
jgi:hypothetical protein